MVIPKCEIGNPKLIPKPDVADQKPMLNAIPSACSGLSAPNNYAQGYLPTAHPSYLPSHIIPVAALNPYKCRWTTKARVTAKQDIRYYNNAKGDGRVFSFDLLDSDGGEIRVTCFCDVVDKFYDTVEVGKVYLVSKGILKPARKEFNHLKNEWELCLMPTSTVDLCADNDVSIPQQHYLILD